MCLQVPLDLRSMWRQRLRWFKGGHLFVLNRESIFWRRQPHVTLTQKLAYCLGPIAHFVNCWSEPIMFTLPFFCLVGARPLLLVYMNQTRHIRASADDLCRLHCSHVVSQECLDVAACQQLRQWGTWDSFQAHSS